MRNHRLDYPDVCRRALHGAAEKTGTTLNSKSGVRTDMLNNRLDGTHSTFYARPIISKEVQQLVDEHRCAYISSMTQAPTNSGLHSRVLKSKIAFVFLVVDERQLDAGLHRSWHA